MPATSRASRSPVTPGRTGRRSPCSSARARSIRTTRTRGPRSGGATTTRAVRRRWERSVPAIGSGAPTRAGPGSSHISAAVTAVVLQIDAGRLQDGYDIARRLVARRPDSGEGHFALARPPLRRAAGGFRSRVRRGHLPRSDQSTVPDLLGDVHSARAIRSGARLRPPGLGSEWSRLVTRWVYQRLGRRDDAREQHRQQSPNYPPGWCPQSAFSCRALSLGRRPDRRGTVER